MSKPAYYAVIPADVRYDKRLTPGAKLMYGEITALCNERGYCWALNGYFAALYEVTDRTIQNHLEKLRDTGYIHMEHNAKSRKIFLTESRVKLISPSSMKLFSPTGDKIFTHNTTSNSSSFSKEKKEDPSDSKRGKKTKYPGDEIFEIAKSKYPKYVTDASIKSHKDGFIEHFTEGDGQLVSHVNWPLTFKNWVVRQEAWGKGKMKEISQRVVIDGFAGPCKFCETADAVGKPCPVHKKGGIKGGKTDSKNVQPAG